MDEASSAEGVGPPLVRERCHCKFNAKLIKALRAFLRITLKRLVVGKLEFFPFVLLRELH